MDKYSPPKLGQFYDTPKYPPPPPRFKLEPKYIRLPISGQNLGNLIFILVVMLYLIIN